MGSWLSSMGPMKSHINLVKSSGAQIPKRVHDPPKQWKIPVCKNKLFSWLMHFFLVTKSKFSRRIGGKLSSRHHQNRHLRQTKARCQWNVWCYHHSHTLRGSIHTFYQRGKISSVLTSPNSTSQIYFFKRALYAKFY